MVPRSRFLRPDPPKPKCLLKKSHPVGFINSTRRFATNIIAEFDVGAVALADPLAVPFPNSIDRLTKDSRITPKAFGTKDDGDDDWVDFSNYKKLKGSSEFIEIGATKFRISPPPGSASRLAKILKDRGRWTGNYTAKKTYSVPCDGINNLAQWGHPPLVSV